MPQEKAANNILAFSSITPPVVEISAQHDHLTQNPCPDIQIRDLFRDQPILPPQRMQSQKKRLKSTAIPLSNEPCHPLHICWNHGYLV
jgi:hypothetical protein